MRKEGLSGTKWDAKNQSGPLRLKGRACVCVSRVSVPVCARVDAYMIYTADTATPAEER